MTAAVVIRARQGAKVAKIDGTRVHFSTHQCFKFDDSAEERACVGRLATFLLGKPGLAVIAAGPLLGYLLKHAPELRPHFKGVIPFKRSVPEAAQVFPQLSPDALPSEISNVFLCDTLTLPRMQMRRLLPKQVAV